MGMSNCVKTMRIDPVAQSLCIHESVSPRRPRVGICLEMFDLPDTGLASRMHGIVPIIAAALFKSGAASRQRIDLVLTHHLNDAHPEHRAASEATAIVARHFRGIILQDYAPSARSVSAGNVCLKVILDDFVPSGSSAWELKTFCWRRRPAEAQFAWPKCVSARVRRRRRRVDIPLRLTNRCTAQIRLCAPLDSSMLTCR